MSNTVLVCEPNIFEGIEHIERIENNHLSVPDHYHADKDNVDVGSQRFIMVDFINLKENEEKRLPVI